MISSSAVVGRYGLIRMAENRDGEGDGELSVEESRAGAIHSSDGSVSEKDMSARPEIEPMRRW